MRKIADTIEKYLPKGWEEAAKREGALIRSRQIKTARELLQLIFMYVTDEGSHRTVSAIMTLCTAIQLSAEAVRKRIKNSAAWLWWMCAGMLTEQGYVEVKPQWLGERRVILVDATEAILHGSKTSDYRIHYAFELFTHTCNQFEVTEGKEGERLSRFTAHEGDIFIADRAYGTITGMEHIREAGAGFILRLKTNAFILYDEEGKRVSIMPDLRLLSPWEPYWRDYFYKNKEGKLFPVRIVATRKDAQAVSQATRRLSRTAARKQRRAVTPQSAEMAEYIVVATNLPDPAERVLELYRARWQIECVFHRLKALFSIGEPPGSNPDSVKAWFYGKLLYATLCEAIVKASHSPP